MNPAMQQDASGAQPLTSYAMLDRVKADTARFNCSMAELVDAIHRLATCAGTEPQPEGGSEESASDYEEESASDYSTYDEDEYFEEHSGSETDEGSRFGGAGFGFGSEEDEDEDEDGDGYI